MFRSEPDMKIVVQNFSLKRWALILPVFWTFYDEHDLRANIFETKRATDKRRKNFVTREGPNLRYTYDYTAYN